MSDNPEDTGQISVAELLARNGQQVESRGGRRRRGAPGGISVAELTGELPIVTDSPVPTRGRRAAPEPDEEVAATAEPPVGATADLPVRTPAPESSIAAAALSPTAAPADSAFDVAPTGLVPPLAEPEYTQAIPALRRAVLAKADADRKADTDRRAAALKPAAPKPAAPRPAAPKPAPVSVAEPAAERTQIVAKVAAAEPPATQPAAPVTPLPTPAVKPPLPTRTPPVQEPALLLGGSLAADLLRQARSARNESLDEARALVQTTGEFPRMNFGSGPDTDAADADADTEYEDEHEPAESDDDSAAPAGGAVRQWLVLVGQAVVAIGAGALLFKGFEKLWQTLPWVAMVLAVLVIAGLVAVVRILRQTEDLVSLLIAVIVGVLVTIGPLLFVLSSS